jgi:outer membrane protein X
MKKSVFITLITSLAATSALAQYDQEYAHEYKEFMVGVGIGYAQPGAGEGAGGGFLAYLEPAYRATDQVLVALKMEGAFIVRGLEGISDDELEGDATSVASFTLNSHYYFNNNQVRPFVGAGVGLYSLAAAKFTTANNGDPGLDEIGAETRFGFYPKIGIDAGHFNLTLDYNVVPPTDVPGGGEIKNSYLGIRAGVSIGGGRTKPINK